VAKKKAAPVDSRVVVHDEFDNMAYERVSGYDGIQEVLQPQEGVVFDDSAKNAVIDLSKDVFTSLYRVDPEVDQEKPDSIQKDVVEEFLKMKEYQDYHSTSQMDAVPCAIGVVQMTPVLLAKIDEVKKEIEKKREEQREKNRQEGKDENDGLGEPRFSDLGGSMDGMLRQAFRKGLQQAQDENDEITALMRTWGVEKGELIKMEPLARIHLAEKLRSAGKLKNMSQVMGRFRNVLNAALATVPSHGQDEIVDIGYSGNLNRILPAELSKLEEFEDLFIKDLVEKNLLSYNLRGTENMGKGPIMVAMDVSPSMNYGGREAWAKAFTLTMMHYAQLQRRSCAWAAFETEVVDSEFYPKGVGLNIMEKLRIAELGTSGGTDFYNAMKKIMEMHAKEPDLKPADVLFVTDGEYEFDEEELAEVLAWKRDKQVRIFGVGICDHSNYERASFGTLEQFCDQICMVNNMGDISALTQVVHYANKKVEHEE